MPHAAGSQGDASAREGLFRFSGEHGDNRAFNERDALDDNLAADHRASADLHGRNTTPTTSDRFPRDSAPSPWRGWSRGQRWRCAATRLRGTRFGPPVRRAVCSVSANKGPVSAVALVNKNAGILCAAMTRVKVVA